MNISTDLSDEKIQSFLLKDSMGQNAFLSSLIKLLVEVDDGSIVDLDGQWGSGKTSVIREIQLISESALDIDDVKNIDKDIIKELQMNYSIFYFNAWENDQYNPSESIVYQLIAGYWGKQEEIGANILAAAESFLFNLVRITTCNLITPDDYSEHNDVKKMIQGIQSINDRKTAASNIILGVLEKSNKNHLIFVIDELDRCNPRYAVKLIEVIKHYFINVPIKVLFVTNNKQLSSIIEKNYGEKFSGYEYLDKIFDLIVNMPSYSHKEFIGMHGRVYDSQFSEAMIAVSDYYEMSLREMERYILLAELSTEHIDSPYLSDSHPNELRQLKYFTKYFLIPLLLGSKIKNEKDFTVLMSFKQNAVTRLNEIVSNIKYAQQMIKNFNTGTSLMYDATRIYSELISSDNYRTAQETEIIRQLLMNMVSNIVM